MNAQHEGVWTAQGHVQPLRVVCLCAAWCRTCDAYRDTFTQVAAAYPNVLFYWLDVEDRHDLVGDLDVETFPSIAIFRSQRLLYLSAVLPHAGVLRRLVAQAAKEGGLVAPNVANLPEGTSWLVQQLTQNWSSIKPCDSRGET